MKTLTTEKVEMLVALIDRRAAAKRVKAHYDPEQNPFVTSTTEQIAGTSDMPAINMVTKAPEQLAFDMESARIAARAASKTDQSARRMAQARARADRKAQFDAIADADAVPAPERLSEAWEVVALLSSIIATNAYAKQRWANRLLGHSAEDIPQIAAMKMAFALAKQTKWDLDFLLLAAEQLAVSRTPGDQRAEEGDSDERKRMMKARKWLMGMVNNRLMDAVVTTYERMARERCDSLDVVSTVAATINGPGEDPMTANFKASRAPAFMGTRFQRPDGIDPNALATAISAAITDRGLDPLVEFLLNEEHRRNDGFVHWSKYAHDIFLMAPDGDGAWMWDVVVGATRLHKHPKRARGKAAKALVQQWFAWLPGVVVSIVEAFDPTPIGYNTASHRKILASAFELYYLPDTNQRRLLLEPALKFATADEAAEALLKHLAMLTTGNDIIKEYA